MLATLVGQEKNIGGWLPRVQGHRVLGLGFTTFCPYINDHVNYIEDSRNRFYVDDTAMFLSLIRFETSCQHYCWKFEEYICMVIWIMSWCSVSLVKARLPLPSSAKLNNLLSSTFRTENLSNYSFQGTKRKLQWFLTKNYLEAFSRHLSTTMLS